MLPIVLIKENFHTCVTFWTNKAFVFVFVFVFVVKFQMQKLMTSFGIRTFDQYSVTKGVRPGDGVHYPAGANTVLARILLQYIQALNGDGLW